MGFLSDTWGALSGSNRAEGAQRSGEAERAGIQEGMDYLKGRDELGNEIGDQALTGLSDYYQGDQQGTIDRAMNSPLYAQMMQAKEDAGEQTMRNASATGGLRGGNVQSDMYKNNLRFDKEALTTTVDQQLEGLGGLTGQRDRNTGNIAQLLRLRLKATCSATVYKLPALSARSSQIHDLKKPSSTSVR